jgi:hypothetical protein
MNISEALRAGELKHLIKNVFEIDNYKSKIGDDRDIVVLSFTVESKDPADDLERFFEMGYQFVMDAESTTGEMDDNKYRVFVEIERSKDIAEQIAELVDGVKKLTGMEDIRFRYHKEFKSKEATVENLASAIPTDPNTYDQSVKESTLNNFSNFFRNSYVDDINLLGENIKFKRIHKDPIELKIVDFGNKHEIHEGLAGAVMLESKSISETMFLTKYIGDFNITKIGNQFIFENKDYALILEKANVGF